MTVLANEVIREAEPTERITESDLAELSNLVLHWDVIRGPDSPQLVKRFKFKDFATALAFTNSVGELAEQENHHPEIVTAWGAVSVKWWTHSVGGLHRNDFIMAAKVDQLSD